jgi:hypothetical protein
MEDHEPDDEGHAVRREVQALSKDHLLGAVQPENARLVAGELACPGQGDPDADRYGHERQRLLEHVRRALALPGPPADQVADHGASEPSGGTGLPGRDVQQLADQVRQLGGAQREHGGRREADQAPASLALQPSPRRSWDQAPEPVSDSGRTLGRRGTVHTRPWLNQSFGSVRLGIQYGTRRGPGKPGSPGESTGHPQLTLGTSPGRAMPRRRDLARAGRPRGSPGILARLNCPAARAAVQINDSDRQG